MDGATLPQAEGEIRIDLRRTTGEWERPALARVAAEPLDLTEDVAEHSARPGLLARTLSVFTR